VAERSQYQYQPVTGPVWREPVAGRLAWLPEGQQPARALQPNRLGDYAQPAFDALYRPAGLQWQSVDDYTGRPLPRARLDGSIYPLQPPAVAAYDPSRLEWMAAGRQPWRALPYALRGSYVIDPVPPVNPAHLSWSPYATYTGKTLPRVRLDWSIYPLQPPALVPYDPRGLQWMALGRQPWRGRPIAQRVHFAFVDGFTVVANVYSGGNARVGADALDASQRIGFTALGDITRIGNAALGADQRIGNDALAGGARIGNAGVAGQKGRIGT
jgi:hypothetical protein